MKLIELIQIKNTFKPDMKFGDIQVTYRVMKFLKQIENDCAFYENKLMEIAQECAEKDGDKIKTTEDGGFYIAKDKMEDFSTKTSDLANLEVDIELPSFKIEDFGECNLTLAELQRLELLISE